MAVMRIISFGVLGFGMVLALTGCGQSADKGADNKSAQPTPEATISEASVAEIPKGQALYADNCLSCHQANGGGVPNMQPALTNSSLLSGAKPSLIEFVLTAEREGGSTGEWLGVMPPFGLLSDEEIADILTYARSTFVTADAVSPAEVASVRQKIAN